MKKRPVYHPLDKLINDDKLFLLEAMIPFVDERMKAPLAMYIKITEIQLILRAFRNTNYVNQCGLCRDINNQDEILAALADCGFGDIAGQMNQLQSAMRMMNMMSMMEQSAPNREYDASLHEQSADEPDTLSPDTRPDRNEDDIPQNPNFENSQENKTSASEGNLFHNIMDILDEYDNTY